MKKEIVVISLVLLMFLAGCSTGEAIRTKALPAYDESKCIDSDNGISLKEQGTTQGKYYFGFAAKTDFCNRAGDLVEYYCGRGKVHKVNKDCSELGDNYDCKSGKCVSSDPLEQVFGISSSSQIFLESKCSIDWEQELTKKSEELEINYQVINEEIGDINVNIWIPESDDNKLQISNEGMVIIKSVLPIMEKYLGPYPCESLFVESFQSLSGGLPGLIGIGGDNGVNHPWLLSHELTHSYFYDKMSPEWLAEGSATSLPFIYITEVLNNPPDFWTIDTTGTNYNIEDDLIYNKPSDVDWDKPVCQLDEFSQSYFGRFLIEELYLEIGKQNILDVLSLVYSKYKHTNEKITNNDFCKAVLYYTPQNKQSEIKKLLNLKAY